MASHNSDEAPSLARLVVALDGSPLAETALPLMQTLAAALKAQVVLLHVLEHEPPATVHGHPHLANAEDAEAYLKEVAQRLRRVGLDVVTHVHTDAARDVAAGIAAHAAELNADLIALAAHGGGGLREWLVGRIPQTVAAQAKRPVLIVPAPAERDVGTVRRIMLPVDPAGEAKAAQPLTQRLAAACRADLVLLTVIPTPSTMPGDAGVAGIFLPRATGALLDWAEQEALSKLEELAGSLRAAGLSVSIDVQRGDPAHEIVQAISAQGIDLVVMATHARAGLDGLLAGSVTPRVVGSMPCPLLLVPIRG